MCEHETKVAVTVVSHNVQWYSGHYTMMMIRAVVNTYTKVLREKGKMLGNTLK
jgi:hypothetical protein